MRRKHPRGSGECLASGVIPPAPGFYRVNQVYTDGRKTLWAVCRVCWFSYEFDFNSSPGKEPTWPVHNNCPRCGREGKYEAEAPTS